MPRVNSLVTAAIVIIAFSLSIANESAQAQRGPALPRLRVSENRRFLVTADGRPFFYLGDTAWELFHRLKREDADALSRRTAPASGFTVIQAVALAEFDGLGAAERLRAHAASQTTIRRSPNEDYFAHVDWIVDAGQRARAVHRVAADLGRQVEPASAAPGRRSSRPRTPRPTASGSAGGTRTPDIIWILGGDRPVENDAQKDIIRAMARGLRKGDGGAHLMTFHPPGGAGLGDVVPRRRLARLQHAPERPRRRSSPAATTRRASTTTARRPSRCSTASRSTKTIRSRSTPKKLGHSIASDVRRPLYWDLFSGAFGHTYGHHSVWQMWTPARAPINNPLMPWTEAIDQPGAAQMQHGRALIESRPFLTRIPDDDVDRHRPRADQRAGRRTLPLRRDARRSRQLRDGVRPGRPVVHRSHERDHRRAREGVVVQSAQRAGDRRSARSPTRASARSCRPTPGEMTRLGARARRRVEELPAARPSQVAAWNLVSHMRPDGRQPGDFRDIRAEVTGLPESF